MIAQNFQYQPLNKGLESWMVGRTPWSAADALVGLCEQEQQAGQGAGCRPGGLPHWFASGGQA